MWIFFTVIENIHFFNIYNIYIYIAYNVQYNVFILICTIYQITKYNFMYIYI